MTEKVVLILSGGLDSTTLLYDIINQGYDVYVLSFNYGQRHRKELRYAKQTCKKLNIPHKIVKLECLNELLQGNSLTSNIPVPHGMYNEESMKQTVVPNRNMIMLSIAAGYAISIKATKIFYGAHSGDHCLIEGSKIFTPTGLKNIEDLQRNDNIYSYNIKNNIVENDKVINIIKNGVNNKILNIRTSCGNLEITDEHKIYKLKLSNFDKNGWSKEIELVKANQIEKNDYILQMKMEKINNNFDDKKIDLLPILLRIKKEYYNNKLEIIEDKNNLYFKSKFHKLTFIPRYSKMLDFINILIWYITEGHTHNKKRKSDSSFASTIYQSLRCNLIYSEEILSILKDNNFLYKIEYKIKDNVPIETCFYFSGTLSAIMQTCGKKSIEKHIPNWMFDLIIENKELIPEIITTFIKGDGSFSNNIISNNQFYTSISDKLLEQISFLSTIAGYKVNTFKSSQKHIVITMPFRKENATIYKNLYISKILDIQIEENKKNVYDISVEKNHNFFAGKYGLNLVSNSIYPDCRPEFVDRLNSVIQIADWHKVELIAPYLYLDKGDIIKKGIKLKVPYKYTWTCYEGKEIPCGKCGACIERAEAFMKAGVSDSLL